MFISTEWKGNLWENPGKISSFNKSIPSNQMTSNCFSWIRKYPNMLGIEDFCRVIRANLARSRKSWVKTAGNNPTVSDWPEEKSWRWWGGAPPTLLTRDGWCNTRCLQCAVDECSPALLPTTASTYRTFLYRPGKTALLIIPALTLYIQEYKMGAGGWVAAGHVV